MRTIQEIKKSMTDQVLRNETLTAALGLDKSISWEEQTSSVSILNMLIYIVAVGHYILESMFDNFKSEVEERIAAAYPGSISWLWNRAMEFQDDNDMNAYFLENGAYQNVDASKRIIKYASVIEEYNTVVIKVSGENYQPLTEEQKTSFEAYMTQSLPASESFPMSQLFT